jgi:N-acetylglucosaminyldiphosphoundecaprenol N-acetyl-beta-D-mannosaminyltransferase
MKFVSVFDFSVFSDALSEIPLKNYTPLVINTISPNSFGISTYNQEFKNALLRSDILVLDGVYFALASILLHGKNIKKNQGPDLFNYFLELANEKHLKVFFMGSTKETLNAIKNRVEKELPNIQCNSYSPPFKEVFGENDDLITCSKINESNSDILFIGLTCPKQEIWSIKNKDVLNVKLIISVGNVFDWYAGTQKSIHPVWFTLRLGWLIRIFIRPEIFKRNIGNQMIFFKVLIATFFSKSKRNLY